MQPVRLAAGPEFDRVVAVLRAAGAAPGAGVLLGPGDDAAAVMPRSGESLVLSADLCVEEVHFRRAWVGWESVGYRAAAGALSDLAAMAARPIGALFSFALPPEAETAVAESVAAGLGECLRRHGAGLLGGDISASPGPVFLDVVAVGAAERPVGRGGARAGDEVWVTGALGGAAAAAAAWARGLEPDPRARLAFERPTPRLAEARWLVREVEVHAMIDLSDGLGGDARHLAAASGLQLELEMDRLPLHEVLLEWWDGTTARRLAVGGGEDYELLLAVAPGLGPRAAEFRRQTGCDLTRVGRVREGKGVRWVDRQGGEVSAPGGWDHFGGGGG